MSCTSLDDVLAQLLNHSHNVGRGFAVFGTELEIFEYKYFESTFKFLKDNQVKVVVNCGRTVYACSLSLSLSLALVQPPATDSWMALVTPTAATRSSKHFTWEVRRESAVRSRSTRRQS